MYGFSDPQQVSDLDVYKIFTSTPMTFQQVQKLFHSFSEIKHVDWKAYPKYDQVPTDASVSGWFLYFWFCLVVGVSLTFYLTLFFSLPLYGSVFLFFSPIGKFTYTLILPLCVSACPSVFPSLSFSLYFSSSNSLKLSLFLSNSEKEKERQRH